MGLCALGKVLRAADETLFDEATLSGLGYLIETVGNQLLETSQHGREIAAAPPG